MPEWSDELFFVIVSHLPTNKSLIQFSTACKRSHAAVKNEWLTQFRKVKGAMEVLTIQPSSKWIEFTSDSTSIKIIHPEECCAIQLHFENNKITFAFSKMFKSPAMIMFSADLGKDEVYIMDLRKSYEGCTPRDRDMLKFIQEKALCMPVGMTLATLRLTKTVPDEEERREFMCMMRNEPFKAKPSSNTSKPFRKRDTTAPPQLGPIFAQSRDVCST